MDRYGNLLRDRLERREFVASIEFVTPEASEPFEAAIAPIVELAEHIKADARFHTIAVTDRVKSDDDHDPVRVAARVAEACGKAPTVHLSGKDRDAAWVEDALGRMRGAGLENLLLITGDKVKTPPAGRPVRYRDSVDMIVQARGAGARFHVAAAVSPFKYREEELMNQYLKMGKKEQAGAAMLLGAFAALQFRKVRPQSLSYLLLNVAGSGLLAVAAGLESLWAFVTLNTVWSLVSLRSLMLALRG